MLSMEAMTYHQRVWFHCAFWHLPGQPRWYFWYSLALIIFIYLLFPLCIATQLGFTNTIEEFTDVLLILPTAALGVKSMLVALNQTKILQLFEMLKKMDAFVSLPEHQDIIRQQIISSRQLMVILSCEYYMSVSAHFLVAVVSGTALMWPAWFPMDYANSRFWYYAINLYLFGASLFIAYVSSSLDIYGIALYKLLGAHFDVLALQLRRLGYRVGSDLKTVYTVREQTEWHRRNEYELGRCIQYHMYCCDFSNLLNRVISVHYFLQFGLSIAIVCGSEFKLVSIDPMEDVVHYSLVIGYVIGLLFEIFLPCFVGTMVLAKSNQMLGAMYECNWMEQTRRFKSAMLIFGERAKQPVAPMAGGLFPLEMSMFFSTMKLAYSMLAVLKTME